MAKSKRTPLEKIQTLETSKVAKLFFFTYITPSIVTKIMHKKAYKQAREKNQQGFAMRYINECLKEWKEAGFIETSPVKLPFPVEKKKGKSYFLKNYGYRLNLKPLYLFCKERHNIKFSQEEKKIINNRLSLEVTRKRIFREYPNDDIINAILKFYIKQFAIPPLEILDKRHRRVLELAEQSNEKEFKFAEKTLKIDKNKSSKKQFSIITEREIEAFSFKAAYEEFGDKKTEKLNVSSNELKEFETLLGLKLYVASYKNNPKLITSINKKFKIALGIAQNFFVPTFSLTPAEPSSSHPL